jgi:hypothetical protein
MTFTDVAQVPTFGRCVLLPSSGRKSGSGGFKGVPPQHQCDILPKVHPLNNDNTNFSGVDAY